MIVTCESQDDFWRRSVDIGSAAVNPNIIADGSQAKSGKDCGGKQLSDRRVLRPTETTRITLPTRCCGGVGPTDAVRGRDEQTSAAPGDNDDATRRIIILTT